MDFLNRISELKIIAESSNKVIVLFGRRRVGKTALVKEFLKQSASGARQFFYSQAIETSTSAQIEQIQFDCPGLLPDIPARDWRSFLTLLAAVEKPTTLVIDEFPYLVKQDASLPSRLQAFLDHNKPPKLTLLLLGSSQTMMHDTFLTSQSPLYDRADKVIHVEPMGFAHFCNALELSPKDENSFLIYSMVGGIPSYWAMVKKEKSPLSIADELYFGAGARLENEPDKLLKDENIAGEQAKAILELIGRGAHKPSELANRLGIKQTSLSKPLRLLRDASLISREIPFGETPRSTKKFLYKIKDPSLRFWFQVFSPHQTRWPLYSKDEKAKLLFDHASGVFEDEVRKTINPDGRYWEKNCEFDCVRYTDSSLKSIELAEIKFYQVGDAQREVLLTSLEQAYSNSDLAKKVDHVEFSIIDQRAGLDRIVAGSLDRDVG